MRLSIILPFVALISISLARPPWAGNPNNWGPRGGEGLFLYYLQSYPKQSVSQEEINGLIHMREEEKLARDVYLTLYNKWRLPIFSNMARSEQIRMDAIKSLLIKYGIKDPVAGNENRVGYFSNPKFVKLYKDLVAQGSKSLIDALKVGALIEDLDIKDLEDYISKTDNRDIAFVYQNLMKGSRNHLRAFIRTLYYFGGNYSPKYISPQEFEAIINSPMERGVVNEYGQPMW